MRVLGLMLVVAAVGLTACAGPADPSVADRPLVYRVGSRIKQPDVAQPNVTYYGQDQFANSPNFQVSGVLAHSIPTPVPPPPESAPQ